MTTEERAVIKEHGLKTLVVDDDDISAILIALGYMAESLRPISSLDFTSGPHREHALELIERIKDQTQ